MAIRIGVSGHQSRPGLDWNWTAQAIRKSLSVHLPIRTALTSLAVGCDQVFAREALDLQIPITAIIPFVGYDKRFTGLELDEYQRLLSQSHVITLAGVGSDEQAYLAAGRYIVEHCDLMIAVWDGRPASGRGGTADIVEICMLLERKVIHIDPVNRCLKTLY